MGAERRERGGRRGRRASWLAPSRRGRPWSARPSGRYPPRCDGAVEARRATGERTRTDTERIAAMSEERSVQARRQTFVAEEVMAEAQMPELRHRDGHVRRRAHRGHARRSRISATSAWTTCLRACSPSSCALNEHVPSTSPAASVVWPWSATRATATSSAILAGRAFLHVERPGVSYKHRCSSMPPTTSSSPVTSRAAAGIRCAPTAPPSAQGIQRERDLMLDGAFATAPTTSSTPPIHAAARSCAATIRGLFAHGRASASGLVGHRVLLRLQARRAPTMRTSSWTCASCRTPITIRNCGR